MIIKEMFYKMSKTVFTNLSQILFISRLSINMTRKDCIILACVMHGVFSKSYNNLKR